MNTKVENFDLITFTKKNRYNLLLILISIVFLINTIPHVDNQVFLQNSDPSGYIKTAIDLTNNPNPLPIGAYTSPGYPIILSIFMKIFGASIITAETISLFFGFLTLFLLYFTIKKVFKNEIIAIIGTFIYSIDPFVIFYSTNVFKEIIINFFILLIIYIVINEINNKKIKGNFFIGLIIGFLIYLNSWVYLLIPIIFYPFIIEYLKNNNKRIKNKINLKLISKKIFMFILGFIIMCGFLNLMYFIPLNGESTFFLTNGGILLYLGNNPTPSSNIAFTSSYGEATMLPLYEFAKKQNINYSNLTTAQKSKISTKYVLNYWLDNPGFLIKRFSSFLTTYWLYPNEKWAQRYIENKNNVFNYLWIKWIFTIIGLIFLLTRKSKDLIEKSIILYPIILVTIIYGLSIYLMRYKFYIVPYQIIIASLGLYVTIKTITKIIKENLK